MLNLLLSSEPTYFSDTFEPYAIWGTVCIVAILAISWLIVFFKKKEISGKVAKKMLIGFVFYALVLGILLLILEIAKKYDSWYLEDNYVSKNIITQVFLPLLITTILALASAITLFIISKKKPQLVKLIVAISGGILLIAVVVSSVMIYNFYSNNINGDGYYTGDYGQLNNVALYISASLLVVGAIFAGLILGKSDKKGFDTKCIATAGICVALSFVLSYIKIFELPYGGSITLFSMFPVMLFAYVYGVKKGLVVGLLYGILQAIQDPFIIHPMQFLLDYPLAFAMLGFAGCLSHFNVLTNKPRLKFTLSAIIAGTLRWICHVLSGVFAFGAYTLDAIEKSEGIFSVLTPTSNTMANFWIYSTIYNSYVFIDVILVVAVSLVLLSSKAFRKELDKLNTPLY